MKTAQEAAFLTERAKNADVIAMIEQIGKDIISAAGKGRNSVEYCWSNHAPRYTLASPLLEAVFPGLKEDLYTWDNHDKQGLITATGTYIRDELERLGYTVFLGIGRLTISWPSAPDKEL